MDPFLSRQQAHDRFQERRFPRSIPPDKKPHLSLFDAEGYPMKNSRMAVGNV